MKEKSQTITIEIPADAFGNSINGPIVSDIVDSALKATPCVVLNHVQGAFNEFAHEVRDRRVPIQNMRDDLQNRYDAAVKLAGIAMRYAWENRPR